jgi:opacity protein-like surface antigen
MRLFYTFACAGSALALVATAPALAQDVVQQKVRVTNGAVNPVTFNLDGKSKDIRPRKALTFTVGTWTPTFSIYFHNGVMDRGDINLNQSAAVIGPDGAQYRCILLGDTGMEVEPQSDCEKKVNKPKG